MSASMSALRPAQVASQCSISTRPFGVAGAAACRGRSCSSRRACIVRAAAEPSPSSVPAEYKAPPQLSWPTDTETFKDVFAVSGPLAERLNGRLAMLGFVGIALAELKSQTPALEQAVNDIPGLLLLGLSLTFGSIMPKFVSGRSLQELNSAATGENLKTQTGAGQVLGLFDTNVELWTGRVAMVGVAGLIVVEAVTGRNLF